MEAVPPSLRYSTTWILSALVPVKSFLHFCRRLAGIRRTAIRYDPAARFASPSREGAIFKPDKLSSHGVVSHTIVGIGQSVERETDRSSLSGVADFAADRDCSVALDLAIISARKATEGIVSPAEVSKSRCRACQAYLFGMSGFSPIGLDENANALRRHGFSKQVSLG
jgi:hypothetical protein